LAEDPEAILGAKIKEEVHPEHDHFLSRHFLTIVGAMLLILVSITPVWDCVILLWSDTYVYFLGRSTPFWVISFCIGIVVVFLIAMMAMERLSRMAHLTDQTFMYLFTATITTLGLGLLCFSLPLQWNTKVAYTELMRDCNIGPRTEPLYNYYNALLKMRVEPDCINLESIEQCAGYEEHYPFTGFLKQMELGYMCSGFCYGLGDKPLALGDNSTLPLTAVLAQQASEVSPSAGNLIEANQKQTSTRGHSGRHPKRQDTQTMVLLSAEQTLSRVAPLWETLPQGAGDTGNNMIPTGWMRAYPPTLFTNANFKTTCEGAAARELRFTAVESGILMYLEGAALLVTSIIMGFLKILSMCKRPKQEDAEVDIVALNPEGDGQLNSYAKKIML
jgi:hypothetical protein